ncbi:unnamed protein product [Phytophthora lilii]|uniref:Unnamed protein product n=1 Tax=Phytophthora lilii TaxID=2077276 RepID=A0A9W6TVZ2_9STRA|nr:unnamed protein product [Phytophthora lilii]
MRYPLVGTAAKVSSQRTMSMLGLTTGSARRRLHGSAAGRGHAWRGLKSAALELKLRQSAAAREQLATAEDAQPPENLIEDAEDLVEACEPPKRGIFTKFRLMALADEDEESDYVPSEESDSEEEQETEEGEEEEEEEEDEDLRWWESEEDKRRWEKRYRQKDAAFRKRFGCGIDTLAQPETKRRRKREKSRHRAYTFVLVGLVVAYLVQLAVVYSASSWAFSMVAWRPMTTEESVSDKVAAGNAGRVNSNGQSTGSKPTALLVQQVPDHVRTGLHLCATLSRRVVKSEHDVTATQHALRACDIAVKFSPLQSREAIEAHVLRGDLRSLLSLFDDADEDYKTALAMVLELTSTPELSPELSQDLDLKLVANRWTQLYKTKSFKELRREAKSRVAQQDDNTANAMTELAASWLSAFKQKKPVLEVLTLQRSWTLHRLKYEALDDDKGKIKPNVA